MAHPGRIRLVIRYAPFHHGADQAVRILEAARQQGLLWETLELLYQSQRVWTRHHQVQLDAIWPLLPRVGLDVERVRADMRDPSIDAVILATVAGASGRSVGTAAGGVADCRFPK